MFSVNIAAALRPRSLVLCALTAVSLLSSPFIAAATAPQLSGTPVTSVAAAHYFSFQPGVTNPSGSKLTFAVVNKPSWATFDSATGRLYGTPIPPGNVGTFKSIVISASAGTLRGALPAFALTVLPLANSPPKISGSAATSATPGQAYSFQPTAQDPNGLRMSFAITSKPAWLAFDSTTGRLYGTPAAKDVGTYSGIVITAYDGYSKAVLPAFGISVQATAGQPAPTPPPPAPTPAPLTTPHAAQSAATARPALAARPVSVHLTGRADSLPVGGALACDFMAKQRPWRTPALTAGQIHCARRGTRKT